MFHKRYQKLTDLTSREKGDLINALDSFQPGLFLKAQNAVTYVLSGRWPGSDLDLVRTVKVGDKVIGEAISQKAPYQMLEDAVEALRLAHNREQMAVYALKLSEYCMYLERWVEAVEVLNEAIVAAPEDIRLAYALATIYRALARPSGAEAEHMYPPGVLQGVPEPLRHRLVASPAIENARSQLGLAPEEARRLSAEHFSRVLEMNVHPAERQGVEDSLQMMREMLQGRVRAFWET